MNIEFSRTIESTFDADHLWRLLVEAFASSEQSPLWPNDLESLRCRQLAEGATLQAVYHVGPIDIPKQHRIETFDRDGRTLSYRAGPDNPLDGGGRLVVEPIERGSQLRWTGEYMTSSRPDGFGAIVFIKGWFERRFFDRLEANLRRLERVAPEDEWRLTA
jgi:hypothetical protein